jgi:hypothetical protein
MRLSNVFPLALATVLLAVIALSGCAAGAATDPATRMDYLRPVLAKKLTQLDANLAKPVPTPSVRDLPNAALTALVLGDDPAKAEGYLNDLFAVQNMDTASPDYGSVPWQENKPGVVDANAVEFSAQALGPIWFGYGNKLSATFKAAALPHLRALLVALRRRNFRDPAYTNIYLMRSESLILIAEAIGDKDTADYGYSELERWIAYTRTHGIQEFDSPTYYGCDYNSLLLGYKYAQRPGAKAIFRGILDYFWADMAGNYLERSISLSGPHSRDYDLAGPTLDFIGDDFRASGLEDQTVDSGIDFQEADVLQNELPGGYQPDAGLLALAALPEKTVISRWGDTDETVRTNYVTSDFAIGSTSGRYGDQDRMFSIELPQQNGAVISFLPTVDDDPYAAVKHTDKSGHSKPVHLPLGIESVQDGATVLGLCSVPCPADATDFTVSLLLPSGADRITLGGTAVDAFRGATPFEIPAKFGDVVGVRLAGGGAAIRTFALQGTDASVLDGAEVKLVGEPVGYKHSAVRLVIRPTKNASLSGGRLRFGFIAMCARCSDDAALQALTSKIAAASVKQAMNADNLNVTAEIAGGPELGVTRSTSGKELAVSRMINGKPFVADPAPLIINGNKSFAAKLLGKS